MLRSLDLSRTDVSEELRASFISVTGIGELGTTLALTSNRRKLLIKYQLLNLRPWLVRASVVPSSPNPATLMKEELRCSETSVLTRAIRRNIPENSIRHSHRRENLKSCIALTGLALQRTCKVYLLIWTGLLLPSKGHSSQSQPWKPQISHSVRSVALHAFSKFAARDYNAISYQKQSLPISMCRYVNVTLIPRLTQLNTCGMLSLVCQTKWHSTASCCWGLADSLISDCPCIVKSISIKRTFHWNTITWNGWKTRYVQSIFNGCMI
jgi:hypothetical protein